jgi:hypothetical protein
MSKSSITVRDVFELPKPGAEETEGWKKFGERVSEEVKGIKSAALSDVAEKVAELFEIPIPDVFLASWKKASGIQALLEESRNAPETVMNTELGEHTINSLHRPHIEIRIQNKTVRKIEFTLKMSFYLKGFVLKIKDGAIRGMQTGLCEVKGKLEYKDLVIAEKKLAPITLPGAFSFENSSSDAQTKPGEEKPASALKPQDEAAKIEERVETKSPDALVEQSQNSATGGGEGESLIEVPEVKAQEVVASELPGVSEPVANLEEVNEAAEVVSPADAKVAEAEERTTWEVGADDEDSLPTPTASGNDLRETSGESTGSTENPQDVIDRMSRELADYQRTENDTNEIGDRAKAGG